MAAKSIPAHQPSDIVLALLVEAGGLVIVTAVAGISDQLANLMLVFVIGVGLLWMVSHQTELNTINTMLNNVLKVG